MRYKLPFLFLLVLLLLFNSIYAGFTQKYDSLGLDLVIIPAEQYDTYRPGSDAKEGETFTMEDSTAGFLGDGYMRANMAAGDGSTSNAETIGIKLSYNIEFYKTGTYYVWALVYFPDDKGDSFFFGIDDTVCGQVSGQPRGSWSWHKASVSITVDSAGVHPVSFYGREPNAILDHIIITSSETFDPAVNTQWKTLDLPGYTQQADSLGLVIMPAEKYNSYRPGVGAKEGETFTMEDSTAGFWGDGYMRANMTAGDGSTTNAQTINIKLSYNVEFVKTGTHYLWAYVYFPDDKGDSFFFGVEDTVTGQVSGQPRGSWSWHKASVSFEIDSAGVYPINFYGREPNAIVDHIIITTSETFDPASNPVWKPKAIVFVSLPGKIDDATGEHTDKPFIDDLKAEGYTVDTLYSSALESASTGLVDSLNEADLVIIGRSITSTDFADAHKTAWNNITSPVMLLHLWAARNSRLNWLPTATTTAYNDADSTISAIIEVPDDTVFTGITITDGMMDWVTAPYDYMAITNGGNGTVIARAANDSNVLFVRWEPWEEFYEDAGDRPAGYRTLIGNGNDASGTINYYNFTDDAKQVYLNEVARMVQLGKVEEPVSVEENDNTIPMEYTLKQNYPNPFNPATTIEFSLPKNSNVKITVYDIVGRVVTKLVDRNYEAGNHKVLFNAAKLASGVYFYKIEAGNFVNVKKLMLLK